MSTKRVLETSVENQSLSLRCHSLRLQNLNQYGTPGVSIVSVSQTNNINETVTTPVASPFTLISTQTSSAATHDHDSFIFSNPAITSTSITKASIVDYSGNLNNGLPFIVIMAIAPGSCLINICNGGGGALGGTFDLFVEVINSL